MLSTFLNDFYKLLLKKYITFIFLWGKELVFDRFLIEKLVSIEIIIKLHSVTHRSFNLYMYNTHTYVQDNRVSECTFWCLSSNVEKKKSLLLGPFRHCSEKKSWVHLPYHRMLEYYTKQSCFPSILSIALTAFNVSLVVYLMFMLNLKKLSSNLNR